MFYKIHLLSQDRVDVKRPFDQDSTTREVHDAVKKLIRGHEELQNSRWFFFSERHEGVFIGFLEEPHGRLFEQIYKPVV